MRRVIGLFLFFSLTYNAPGQLEANNWIFGYNCSLNFSISPPATSTSAIHSTEACASISSPTGGLLFYSDGVTVWNKQHNIMANGTGLVGHQSTNQGAIIVKRPGSSSHYFLFTLDWSGGPNGLRYSTVDMTLSAGMGSVTTKNSFIYSASSEKLTVVSHCNRKDYWLISHDVAGDVFRAFPITSAGVSTVAIVSSFPSTSSFPFGHVKVSHNGKRLVNVTANFSFTITTGFDLYDFDNATGQISNRQNLHNDRGAYSAEFSPDDSRLYGITTTGNQEKFYQWDLCHDSIIDIQNSRYTVAPSGISRGHLKLAADGKIYVARDGYSHLGVINNPNSLGSACNYVEQGAAISGTCILGLPNMVRTLVAPPSFTYEPVGCSTSFSAHPVSGITSSCYVNPPPTSVLWNFGDSLSGSANTSTLQNPLHSYSSGGSFTASVIRTYSCYTDTVKYVLNVNNVPVINVAGKTTVCVGDKVSLLASGATTYTWSGGAVSPSLTLTPTITGVSYYTVSANTSSSSCTAKKIISVKVNNCLGVNEIAASNCKIFPNPAKDILVVVSEKYLKMQITNALGQTVHSQEIIIGENTISVMDLKEGNYIMVTITPDGVKNYYRFIKVD